MPKVHLGLVNDVALYYWHLLAHVMREMITFRSSSSKENLLVDGKYMDLTTEEHRKLKTIDLRFFLSLLMLNNFTKIYF